MPIGIYAELLQETKLEFVFQRFLNDPNWAFQEKHNGERRLITKEGKSIQDFNRKGDPGKGLSPQIISALQKHPLHRFIIDAEYVEAENRLYIFDMLMAGDDMIATSPYSMRLSYIHAHFDGFSCNAIPVESVTYREEKISLVKKLKEIHAEGFCVKDLSAPYRPSNETGTLRYNYKVKFWKSLDAVVIGDSKKVMKGKLRDSVLLGLYLPDGRLHEICGATKKSWAQLTPGTVVEVKYLYGTKELNIVQIDVQRVRYDKRPNECTIDQIEINKNFRQGKSI